MKFYPGLVGGHCIGVDPYYLLHKSKELGYDPEVILSGRRINDQMPAFVAKKLVQLLISKDKNLKQCKVLILGITFKENVSDIRNSKVADLYHELAAYSIKMDLVDSCACSEEVLHEYNIQLKNQIESNYDAVVVAVAHDEYKHLSIDDFKKIMNINPILIDLKGIYQRPDDSVHYWRL